ncbi:MAG: hypothetical protein OEU26_19225 [Candidatus Tectomicrobia bacterium]|nr:hypothetical protein [Candidatus Tectomicrobia bacterium]
MRHKVKTALTSQEALEQAKTYFGPRGRGLAIVSQGRQSLRLRGRSGGHVDIRVKHGFTTTLELETRSWDAAVHQFMAQLPPPRPWWQRWWRGGTVTTPQPLGHTVPNGGTGSKNANNQATPPAEPAHTSHEPKHTGA